MKEVRNLKKGMTFHYLFLFFVFHRLMFGALLIILIPNHIQSLIISYQHMPDRILYWWEMLITDVIMGGICILALPLFYQLVNRVNLNLKKIHFFLWAYTIGQWTLNLIKPFFNPTEITPSFSVLYICLDFVFVALIIQAILKYYQNRTHLFMTETKEARRTKFKALITYLTRGLISFER